MEVKFNEAENKFEVVANANIFIIPNHACKLAGFFDIFQEEEKEYASKMCSDNGTTFNEENDWFVETWLVSKEDLHTENVADHGLRFEYNGKRFHSNSIRRYIMKSLIGGKEGDTVQIRFNDLDCYSRDTDNEYKLDLTLNITLSQENYRYCRFGSFENVLEKVCA